MKQNKIALKIATMGVLSALALVLSAVETFLVPDIPGVPGAKIGLSNVVMMFCAVSGGFFPALYIVLIKALFAFLTRGMTSFLMSLSGGMLSMLVFLLLDRLNLKNLSYIGISLLCAVSFNLGQIICSAFLMGGGVMFHLLKYLTLLAIIPGILNGVLLNVLLKRLKNLNYLKLNNN